MLRVLATAAVAAGFLAACGDNLEVEPDPELGVLDQLNALPGVTAEERPTSVTGYRYFVLQVTQPVDHDAPDGATFQQQVSLLHRDPSAPLIVHTSGYWDYYLDSPVELTQLLTANQISIEHRFFGTSRPSPTDWSKLTIKQMADDQHAIIAALRTIYGGAFVTTGGSKGGMTAVYHRRFYPDDVEATVPYVAPLSLGAPDSRYAPFLDTVGPAACRQAVRDVAVELLSNRRAMVIDRTTTQAVDEGHAYTRIAIGPAVESAIVSLEWAFWQYDGISSCPGVPASTATDDKLWQFLERISPPSDNDDQQVGAFDAYYYQAYAQLGYPDGGAAYLDAYLAYGDADYANALPMPAPAYDDGAAMTDIDTWLRAEGSRLLFVYGQWDPWTAGQFELGQATDSLRLTQAEGTHSARITRLADPDLALAFDRISTWTGVALPTPRRAVAARAPAAEPRAEPRVPPAMRRALRTRTVAPTGL